METVEHQVSLAEKAKRYDEIMQAMKKAKECSTPLSINEQKILSEFRVVEIGLIIERENQVFLAKLAEQAERYDEMFDSMKQVSKMNAKLSTIERTLLSIGFSNVTRLRQASWRILSSIEQELSRGNEGYLKLIKGYRLKIKQELSNVCNEFLSLIDKHLLPAADNPEASDFYCKMIADTHGYLGELDLYEEEVYDTGVSMDREHQVFLAKLAEQAERYDDMTGAMNKVSVLNGDLTIEERGLLDRGYKNLIRGRRTSRRSLLMQESKEKESKRMLINGYRFKIEEEISSICYEILNLIDGDLVPFANNTEAVVFYNKMKGDYYRYLAEFKDGAQMNIASSESKKAYEIAYELASEALSPTHPIRLGLALNFSIFYYEIINNTQMAHDLAKEAYDEAYYELPKKAFRNELISEDTKLFMQLLCKHIDIWTFEHKLEMNEAVKIEGQSPHGMRRRLGNQADTNITEIEKIVKKNKINNQVETKIGLNSFWFIWHGLFYNTSC